MSLQNHLVELQKRHDALDREIAAALVHPATDDAELAGMKRRKLQLKDEINKLSGQATLH